MLNLFKTKKHFYTINESLFKGIIEKKILEVNKLISRCNKQPLDKKNLCMPLCGLVG